MKITLTGSLGNISRPLAAQLVAAGHDVTVISSSAERASEIEKLGAKPAIGSVKDEAFLTEAFSGSDALYLMIPPDYRAEDLVANIAGTGKIYASAVAKSGVKRVVALSSMGAHLPLGNGPLGALGQAEKYYENLNGVDITFLRPGGFYTNYLAQIGVIKHAGIAGDNTAPESRFLITHPSDIADVAADALQKPVSGKTVRFIISDELTNNEIVSLLGSAIGQPGLNWVQFPDPDYKSALVQNGFSESAAQAFVEMGVAFREGRAFEETDAHPESVVYGKRKFADFAKEVFASAFKQ